jgi:hypothetical protein
MVPPMICIKGKPYVSMVEGGIVDKLRNIGILVPIGVHRISKLKLVLGDSYPGDSYPGDSYVK